MTFSITNNHVVSIVYKLTDDKGNVVDSTDKNEPLVYLHGADNLIPGLENALDGRTTGDTLKVVVPPSEAYGELNPALVQSVSRSAFPNVEKIEVGMAFEAEDEDGSVERVVIKEVGEDEVIVDANHPLAGIPLTFEVEVLDIRKGTNDEIAQGYIG